MTTTTKRLPKSVRKHIRKEKNKIRKNISDKAEHAGKIKELYIKWKKRIKN